MSGASWNGKIRPRRPGLVPSSSLGLGAEGGRDWELAAAHFLDNTCHAMPCPVTGLFHQFCVISVCVMMDETLASVQPVLRRVLLFLAPEAFQEGYIDGKVARFLSPPIGQPAEAFLIE